VIINIPDVPGVATAQQLIGAEVPEPVRKLLVQRFEEALERQGNPWQALNDVGLYSAFVEATRPRPKVRVRCMCDCRHCPDNPFYEPG
jgi:hypothetical protein